MLVLMTAERSLTGVFDHKNFATQGLFPGLVTTRSVANLGHFEIQVIIEPIGAGGGWVPVGPQIDKYRVRIIITRKGKKWEYEQIVGSTMAKVAARILNTKIAEPSITLGAIKESKEPEIKVNVNVNRKT